MLLRNIVLKKAPFIGAFFFAATLTAYAAGSGCQTESYDEVATLEKVYDGDTIKLTDGRKVRLIAVNTPEIGHVDRHEQAYASEARAALQSLFANNAVVKLKFGKDRKDRYKRVLAHVFTEEGQNVAAELIRRGLGFAIVVPPNLWGQECYFSVEQEAKLANRGIWTHPDYQPKNALNLKQKDTGFQIVEGVVSDIGLGKKTIWLDMGRHFSVRINRKSLGYFESEQIPGLKDKRIRVRGWVAFYNDKLRMTVKHPGMMNILDE